VRQEEFFKGGLSAEELVHTRSGENLQEWFDRTLDLAPDDVTVDLHSIDTSHTGEIRH
jgi:hypothetical protein